MASPAFDDFIISYKRFHYSHKQDGNDFHRSAFHGAAIKKKKSPFEAIPSIR